MDSERDDQLPRVFSYAVHMVSSLQLAIAGVVLLFPKELLSLAGKQYVLEPQALAMILVGHVILGFLGMTSLVVLGQGKSRALLFFNLAGLALNVLLDAWWIPERGLVGAAEAGVATALCTSLAMVALQLNMTRSWIFMRHLWTNAALVLFFTCAVFAYQAPLLELPLPERLILAVAAGLLLLANVWVKRSRFRSIRAVPA
jgi:O-antigen/teichoic acid export membrane protein